MTNTINPESTLEPRNPRQEAGVRLLITGGSGFIGTNAMDFAIGRNMTVINLDIQPPRKESHHKHWKSVDIRDAGALSQAVEELSPTHIWHLAAKTGMDIRDLSELSANTDGVANLIASSRKAPHLQRTLFTSSLLVCRNGYIPRSDDDYCPPNAYGESKKLGEEIVRSSPPRGEWVIVRPTSVWGQWFEHSYRTFFRVIDRGLYVHPGAHPIVKPLTFVDNTVHMMSCLLFGAPGSACGETMYLADYPEYSIQQWADSIQRILNVRKIAVMPISILRAMARVGDACKRVGWQDFPLTSFRLNNMLTGAHYPTEKIQQYAGRLPYSMEDGVARTAQWMYEQGQLVHSRRRISDAA
jgi:GlcNAc-P-P-Und epimerase